MEHSNIIISDFLLSCHVRPDSSSNHGDTVVEKFLFFEISMVFISGPTKLAFHRIPPVMKMVEIYRKS